MGWLSPFQCTWQIRPQPSRASLSLFGGATIAGRAVHGRLGRAGGADGKAAQSVTASSATWHACMNACMLKSKFCRNVDKMMIVCLCLQWPYVPAGYRHLGL